MGQYYGIKATHPDAILLFRVGDFSETGLVQVELSLTDTRKIGVAGVIRQSGDIKDTPGCKLIAGEKELEIDKGVIVAKRHIHMTPGDAIKMRLKDNEEVFVITQSFDRALIYANVVVRISWDYQLSMHVDTDEANACWRRRML